MGRFRPRQRHLAQHTLVGRLDSDDDDGSVGYGYAFRLDGSDLRYSFDVDPADFEDATVDLCGLTLNLGWRSLRIREAFGEDDPRLAESVKVREIAVPDGRKLPIGLDLPPEAALKSLSIVIERDPRQREWQLVFELRNLTPENASFDVQFVVRFRGNPVALEESYLDVPAGRRRLGRLWFRVPHEMTRLDLVVNRAR